MTGTRSLASGEGGHLGPARKASPAGCPLWVPGGKGRGCSQGHPAWTRVGLPPSGAGPPGGGRRRPPPRCRTRRTGRSAAGPAPRTGCRWAACPPSEPPPSSCASALPGAHGRSAGRAREWERRGVPTGHHAVARRSTARGVGAEGSLPPPALLSRPRKFTHCCTRPRLRLRLRRVA